MKFDDGDRDGGAYLQARVAALALQRSTEALRRGGERGREEGPVGSCSCLNTVWWWRCNGLTSLSRQYHD